MNTIIINSENGEKRLYKDAWNIDPYPYVLAGGAIDMIYWSNEGLIIKLFPPFWICGWYGRIVIHKVKP